jgi:hypothetical protein
MNRCRYEAENFTQDASYMPSWLNRAGFLNFGIARSQKFRIVKNGQKFFSIFCELCMFFRGKRVINYFLLLRGMEKFVRKVIGVTEIPLEPLSTSCGPTFAVNRKILKLNPFEASPGRPGRSEFF